MNRNSCGIHAAHSNRVETDSHSCGVLAHFASNACLCDHLYHRLIRLRDGQENEIGFLRLHPIPILPEKATRVIIIVPRNHGAAVTDGIAASEHDLGPYVEGDDIEDIRVWSMRDSFELSAGFTIPLPRVKSMLHAPFISC